MSFEEGCYAQVAYFLPKEDTISLGGQVRMDSVRQLAAPFLLSSPRLELSITNANRRSGLKAPLHCPIFRATFLSRNVMAKQVARNNAQCNKKRCETSCRNR